MKELAWERMMMAIRSVALCEAAIEWTVAFTRDRKAFGRSVFDMQNSRFKLAECKTETQVARVFVDRCIELVVAEKLDSTEAAMAKYWTTELVMRVLDTCLQLHGGAGVMWEYPICRAYADNRFMRIAGGTNEIMRELIGRSL
jgi:alkylation response protein AidB-like acyl-CoA dehydrogenase